MMRSLPSALLHLTACIPLAAGMAHAADEQRRPTIWAFTPHSGAPGTVVAIMGSGLHDANRVTFGGIPATFTAQDRWRLKAKVPAGAVSGPIAVTTPNGTATSSQAFTVTGTAAPTLASFAPAQGPVGTVVTLAGSGFTPGATVAFHGTAASAVTFVSATQLQAKVPAGATTGLLSVTTPSGTATSSGSFTVTQAVGAPTLASFAPAQGPAGTVVTLAGSGFTPGATVAFHGTAASAVTFVSPTQLQATVPQGASSGPLSVTTASGTGTSAASFTVQGPSSTLDLSIGGWYINQSVQTLGRTIPLVAGKNGFLRVFALANLANAAAPKVTVTITGGSPSPWIQTLAAPRTSVPTALAEGDLASSWNLSIPGAVLAPGATLRVDLDPANAIPEANKANNTFTAALTLQKLAPFRTTVIPVTQQGLTGNVSNGGRTLASWASLLRPMYPVGDGAGDLDVALGTPYTTQANLNTGSDGWSSLLGEINAKRVADGTNRYYFGAVGVSYSGGIAGLGYIGAPAAIGWDKDGSYPQVFAHETGHNFNRMHAPCGGPSGVDPSWPTDAAHASAQIGVYGYDTSTGAAMSPTADKDVMSYCGPSWASDYTYLGVLSWRGAGHLAEAPASEPLIPRTECLLVSGHVRNGHIALDPAYMVFTRPSLPPSGEYRIELLDSKGASLLKVPFATTLIADAAGREEQGFAFAIPLDCTLETAYHALSVTGPEGGLVTRNAGPGEVYQKPTATNLGRGIVRVLWDSKAFPTAMVRDSATHEVLAFAHGGTLDLSTGARDLEITLSDGVRSKRFHLNP